MVPYSDRTKKSLNMNMNIWRGQKNKIDDFIRPQNCTKPEPFVFFLLTCADVHDVVQGVHTLNNVHHQVREANIILHDQRVYRLWLNNIVHQVEPLGVLQAALCQALVGTLVVYCTTLVGGEKADRCRKTKCRLRENVIYFAGIISSPWLMGCVLFIGEVNGVFIALWDGSLKVQLTWKLWMGLGVGSQVERGFSWERKGPLKAWVMALRLKAHTADAAILLLYIEIRRDDMTEGRKAERRIGGSWQEEGERREETPFQCEAISSDSSCVMIVHCVLSSYWKSYHSYRQSPVHTLLPCSGWRLSCAITTPQSTWAVINSEYGRQFLR